MAALMMDTMRDALMLWLAKNMEPIMTIGQAIVVKRNPIMKKATRLAMSWVIRLEVLDKSYSQPVICLMYGVSSLAIFCCWR